MSSLIITDKLNEETETLQGLTQLKQYYYQLIQESKSEVESEYYYVRYSKIQQQINELVDKSRLETTNS